ncbi:MAG: serine hydrolase [Acidobacteriota bacterium]|nr:serine hydrolase [Acidobacteriota bacterium]
MKNYIVEILAITIIMMSMSCKPETQSEVKKLEAFFSGLASERDPGIAVLVIKDGRRVFERGYGAAYLLTLQPIDSSTNFRLASLTKQFTAAAVMLLVRDGKIKYDDRLTDFWPEFPAYGKDITVLHLLHHTSGLPDYEDLMPPVDPRRPVEEVQVKDSDVLDLLTGTKGGKFPPGTRWDYSNSGYVLLGLIEEKASGLPFHRFLHDRIFAPLGMDGTVAYVPGLNQVSRRAFGYTREKGQWLLKDQSPTSATLGDGGIYSSLNDLAKWDAALRENTLLKADELKLAFTPVIVPDPGAGPVEPDGTPAAYGFGWFLNPWKGRARAWHYGETAGFRTAIERFLDEGVTSIVLCNRDDLEAAALALKAAEAFLDNKD